ncbi:MAG: M20/M25/M40 family metallo-hydrolase [Candidatus Omnitrophica bacterium]|nr:M20/M25/M40 family metallo-hydrolase [Candidatus Omnitrophota bacterium]
MNDKFIVDTLKSLVNIESLSGSEQDIMLYLEKEIKSWGVKTKRYKTGNKRFNLLARCGQGSPVLCLNAHADTVPVSGKSVPRAKVKNKRLYGLGSCDTKASLAAMMAVFKNRVTSKQKIKGTLDLLVTIDEERKSQEAYVVIKQGYKCDYAIVGEPTNLEIISAHMGDIVLELTAQGKPAHSSRPWKGINAIDQMIETISKIRCLIEDQKDFPGMGSQSMNLGVIQGGDVANRVPDYCQALIDIRVIPGRSTGDILKKLDKIFKRNKNITYKVFKQMEPMKPSCKSSFINLIQTSQRQVTGRSAAIKGARYWTEAAHFQNELGVQTVIFGPARA